MVLHDVTTFQIILCRFALVQFSCNKQVLLFSIRVEVLPLVLFLKKPGEIARRNVKIKSFLILLCCYTVPEEQTISKFEWNCYHNLKFKINLKFMLVMLFSIACIGLGYSFICKGTSTRRQQSDLCGLPVKLPPVTTSLTAQR